MDNGSSPEIPAIVTEDLGSTPVIRVDDLQGFVHPAPPISWATHSTERSDPSLLSPGPPGSGRRSIDSANDRDGMVPPSPTLSTQSSVQFMTSTALRENRPGDGATSLSLLSPATNAHSRRPSVASTAGTVADYSPGVSHLYPAVSDATTSARSAVETLSSPTPTHVGSTSDIGESGGHTQKHRKGSRSHTQGTTGEGVDGQDDEDKTIHLDLAQDSQIDPTPFTFRPYHLASLVDPKSLDTLEAMHGITGLLQGLGVNATSGLNLGGKAPQPGDAPSVVVTDPAGEKIDSHESPAFGGTVEDRQRVYGSNVLPVRRTRTLLELMWLALKDRVLVRPARFSQHWICR